VAAAILGAAFLGALAIVGWAVWPLRAGAEPAVPADPRVVARLLDREAALAELRDLDADHAAGRLADAHWRALRDAAVARAARALAALDRLGADRASAVDRAERWLAEGIEERTT